MHKKRRWANVRAKKVISICANQWRRSIAVKRMKRKCIGDCSWNCWNWKQREMMANDESLVVRQLLLGASLSSVVRRAKATLKRCKKVKKKMQKKKTFTINNLISFQTGKGKKKIVQRQRWTIECKEKRTKMDWNDDGRTRARVFFQHCLTMITQRQNTKNFYYDSMEKPSATTATMKQTKRNWNSTRVKKVIEMNERKTNHAKNKQNEKPPNDCEYLSRAKHSRAHAHQKQWKAFNFI